ncbi:ORF-77 peptide [Corchorus capsularis]|uniref:ORF-77 peptide n=1 Tax=Corchorus capsularis TaxID=210143 RepID=A0A1R3GQJ3_COCAP|nr:ORF-77 peptide [Corchorus capsularis]
MSAPGRRVYYNPSRLHKNDAKDHHDVARRDENGAKDKPTSRLNDDDDDNANKTALEHMYFVV